MPPQISVIVVSFADPRATASALRSLLAQSPAPAETIVVDNDPGGVTARMLQASCLGGAVELLHPGVNLGYTAAANLAASMARGDWLLFINPDAVAQSDCAKRLLDAVDGPDVVLVGAQVLLPDGRTNAGDNPINISGISWSGRYGHEREHGTARDVASVSGAALMVRRDAFQATGGMCPHFFMYFDDADLAWRLRLAGGRVRYCPEAVVVHDYEFQKSAHKWFYLERNRVWALMSNLQIRTLLMLSPLLLAIEIGVCALAIRDGWLAQKLRAWGSLVADAPEILRWRRSVQARRNVSDYAVLRYFCAEIEAGPLALLLPYWVNGCLRLYRRGLLWMLMRVSS